MADYDYANARLRAMKSRLLSPRSLESLTEAGSVQGLITALTNTPYREAVEAAMIQWTGLECLAEALRRDLLDTVGKARRFFSGRARKLIGQALAQYDLHNLKAILRGTLGRLPPSEILANTLPIGDLRPPELAELARAPDARAVIDLLATWLLPWARPLAHLRRAAPQAADSLPALELALDRWHLSSAMAAAREAGDEAQPLLEVLQALADRINVLTALRLVGEPVAAAALRERYGVEQPLSLFVEPGRVSLDLLARCMQAASVPDAIARLNGSPYFDDLAQALEAYRIAPRLSHFERALLRRERRHTARLLVRHPLGVGVFLAYVALKTNEIGNLRAIGQGLALGDPPERIRAELIALDGA